MKKTEQNRKPGRPKEFREEEALEAAMMLFWQKGYEGSSLRDLTDAMGIDRSSMYATLGNKEELFRKVMARYASGPMASFSKALKKPTMREAAKALLEKTVTFLTDPSHPRTCMSLQALSCGDDSEPVKQFLIELRKSWEKAVEERIKVAFIEEGLSSQFESGDLARYVTALQAGLMIQSANGASRKELSRLVELALQCMPF